MRKKSLVMQTQIGVKISTLNFSRHTCKREWDIAESGNKLMKMMSKLKKKTITILLHSFDTNMAAENLCSNSAMVR